MVRISFRPLLWINYLHVDDVGALLGHEEGGSESHCYLVRGDLCKQMGT